MQDNIHTDILNIFLEAAKEGVYISVQDIYSVLFKENEDIECDKLNNERQQIFNDIRSAIYNICRIWYVRGSIKRTDNGMEVTYKLVMCKNIIKRKYKITSNKYIKYYI